MDDRAQFDINESLKLYLNDPASIPTPEAPGALTDCENDPDSLTPALVHGELNGVVDAIADHPDAVSRSWVLDTLQFLLKCAPTSPPNSSPFANVFSLSPRSRRRSQQSLLNVRHRRRRRDDDDASPPTPGDSSRSSNIYHVQGPDSCALFELSRSSSSLPPSGLSKILDLLVSGLSAEADVAHAELFDGGADNDGNTGDVQHHKQLLEIYGFLLQWAVAAVETKAAEKAASSTAPTAAGRGRKGKSKSSAAGDKDTHWDSTGQLQTALDVMAKVMKLKLGRIFVTTSKRDTFVGLFVRPVYLILESEARVKVTALRMHAFRVLCIAVKHHGHAFAAQTSILQNLSYFEHLSEPMAEFLQILAEQYDYPQLTEEVLRELSNKEFNSNDAKGPKSVSAFVSKISELAPRLVIKQMTSLAKLLDSESYTLRCAIIEVCGNLITMLSKQDDSERSENHKAQINTFFDVLEERFLDINPYCRCRAIQVFIRLCDLETKFPKRRQAAAELASRSCEDKSSNVRRNAIKLLGKLITTHPFGVLHGGQLARNDWSDRLDAVNGEIDALTPPEELAEKKAKDDGEPTVDTDLLDDATQVDPQPETAPLTDEEKRAAIEKATREAATAEALNKLQLTRRYYIEALRFIDALEGASMTVTQLLGAKNKSEVIEAMDFFVVADAYRLTPARAGIRRMMRLIWTKGNSDEGKGVQSHLIECYRGLFFDAPAAFAPGEAATFVARNMISLTFGATPAELTSLEQLLSTMMRQGHVSDAVLQRLWQVYGVRARDISRAQRRGAVIVLGMLALARPDVVVREMETCLAVGLGELGRRDFGLARYTCVALQRIHARPAKDAVAAAAAAAATGATPAKLPSDHAVLVRLADMVEIVSDSTEWFGVAEQAIGAIYTLAKHPDALCSEIIRRKTRYVFGAQRQPEQQTEDVETSVAAEEPSGLPSPPPEGDGEQEDEAQEKVKSSGSGRQQRSAPALSQLLFIVGHVAIKQIVHLETVEQDFKRRKAEKEKRSSAAASTSPSSAPTPVPKKRGNKKDQQQHQQQQQQQQDPDDELDLMAGTTEDDFTDALTLIRERELLYGPHSLLASFGTLVADLCANNRTYPDPTLQAQAALCLAKLACVSGEYCEAHLPLLLTVLERSSDATTRANLVVALGDAAVCFNHVVDAHTDFLYRRLRDEDPGVKRTCLMTLTFLILAGQVKVKGQLGEMAKCVEDADGRIRDLARMFFGELATKDNAVYNHFVDMFSLLSADDGLDEERFRRVVKFLAGFIEKDKHAKQLAAKLAARLPRCGSERQWNDVAFTLGLLPHKDEEIQKVVAEGFKMVSAEA